MKQISPKTNISQSGTERYQWAVDKKELESQHDKIPIKMFLFSFKHGLCVLYKRILNEFKLAEV